MCGPAGAVLPAMLQHQQALVVAAQVNLKAKLESNLSYFSFRRLVPGAFNLVFMGWTCTTLPRTARRSRCPPGDGCR